MKEAEKTDKILFKFTGQVQGKNRETIADFFNKFNDDRIFKDRQTYRQYKNSKKKDTLKAPCKSITINEMNNKNKRYSSKDKSLFLNSKCSLLIFITRSSIYTCLYLICNDINCIYCFPIPTIIQKVKPSHWFGSIFKNSF